MLNLIKQNIFARGSYTHSQSFLFTHSCIQSINFSSSFSASSLQYFIFLLSPYSCLTVARTLKLGRSCALSSTGFKDPLCCATRGHVYTRAYSCDARQFAHNIGRVFFATQRLEPRRVLFCSSSLAVLLVHSVQR